MKWSVRLTKKQPDRASLLLRPAKEDRGNSVLALKENINESLLMARCPTLPEMRAESRSTRRSETRAEKRKQLELGAKKRPALVQKDSAKARKERARANLSKEAKKAKEKKRAPRDGDPTSGHLGLLGGPPRQVPGGRLREMPLRKRSPHRMTRLGSYTSWCCSSSLAVRCSDSCLASTTPALRTTRS